MYSRKNLKKLMSLCDGTEGLLDTKDTMDPAIEEMVQYASNCLEIALVKMQLEAAVFAKGKEVELMDSPMFPQVTKSVPREGLGEVIHVFK